MLYDAYEVQRSLLAGASRVAAMGAGWLNNPANPLSYGQMGPIVAASLDVFAHVRQLAERRHNLAAGDFRHRLAELRGLGRQLAVVREDDIHATLDRLLEVLAADLQRTARGHAVGDHDHLGLRSIRLQPGEDADGVAGRGERQLGNDDGNVRIMALTTRRRGFPIRNRGWKWLSSTS